MKSATSPALDRQWSRSSKIRTLVVDDHPEARQELRRVLDADPRLEVLGEAVDGMEAIAVVKERRPDLVLMDLNLPKLDGIAATDYIKRNWPSVKVIGVSSGWGPLVRKAFLQAGADAVLNKEDVFEHLGSVVASIRSSATTTAIAASPCPPPGARAPHGLALHGGHHTSKE